MPEQTSAIVPTGGGQGQDGRNALLMQTFNEAQVDFLLQRTPAKEIKTRQGKGGRQFAYVEHGYVTERLNLVFGFNWDFEVVDKQILDDEVIVEARLTVRTPQGQTIVKTQFGGADIERHSSGAKNGRPLSIADNYKSACSDALKKCASLLGIGLDLYGRDMEPATEDAPPPLPPQQPPAVKMSERHQHDEIRRLIAALGQPEQTVLDWLDVQALPEVSFNRAAKAIEMLHARVLQIRQQHEQPEPQDAGGDEPAPYDGIMQSGGVRGRVMEALQPQQRWARDPDELDQALGPSPQKPAPGSAGAAMITEKQLKAVYAVGKAEKKWTEQQIEDYCLETYGVRPGDLSKQSASEFIGWLKGESA